MLTRVELAAREQTHASSELFDGTAPTATGEPRHDDGPGHGTLMRDLVRAEIERERQPSPLGELFNNTWVLIGLLVLLVLGGIAWFSTRELSPEAKFAAGVDLMDRPEGPEWIEARDKYFQPLLAEDPDRWQEQAGPYLDQIALYEAKSGLAAQTNRRKRPGPRSEAERFLQLAQHYQNVGDLARAEQTLAALTSLLAGQPEQEVQYKLAQQLLSNVRERRSAVGDRDRFLKNALARADQLAEAGRADEALQIWTGLVQLYESDAAAQTAVDQARQRIRAQRRSPVSSTEATTRHP